MDTTHPSIVSIGFIGFRVLLRAFLAANAGFAKGPDVRVAPFVPGALRSPWSHRPATGPNTHGSLMGFGPNMGHEEGRLGQRLRVYDPFSEDKQPV